MFEAERRATGLEARLDTMAQGLPAVGPAADVFGGGWLSNQAWGVNAPRLELGWVADCAIGAHCYRVLVGPGSYVWAALASSVSLASFGPRPANSLALGSEVLLLRHPQDHGAATILAVLPDWSVHHADGPSDAFWPFFRSGHGGDPTVHVRPITLTDQAANLTEKQPPGADVFDFSGGRPLDSSTAGEWGFIAETGVGLFCDGFHAALRVDEMTGVWAFYHDQLLRLAGHTVQRWSTTEEFESGDDTGELYEVRRTWVYPWEGGGLWRWNQVTPNRANQVVLWPGEPPVTERGQGDRRVPAEIVQSGTFNRPDLRPPPPEEEGDQPEVDLLPGGTGEAVLETEYFTQLPAARGFEFAGYLGQAGKRLLAIPPKLKPSAAAYKNVPLTVGPDGAVYAYPLPVPPSPPPPPGEPPPPPPPLVAPNTASYVEPATRDPQAREHQAHQQVGVQPGVLEEHRTLTGGYHVRTARRIVLAKRPSIPVPQQRRLPADADGDHIGPGDEAYKASGRGRTPRAGSVADPLTGFAASDFSYHDVQADLTLPYGAPQRAAVMPDFLAYVFNWEGLHPFVYHEKDWQTPDEGGVSDLMGNQRAPNFSQLGTQQHLDEPTAISYDVDHRYGPVDYTENEAVIAILDDGQIYIHDGWGSQLLMHSGHITATCPGDFNVRAGRNFNVWAGDDINLRARTSVDITAAQRDVRIKAENSAHVLGGNNGCGGILLESKAICPTHAYLGRPGEDTISGGIVMLTPNSSIYALTPDLAVESPYADGRIVFEMGSAGTIRTKAKTHHDVIYDGGVLAHCFQAPGPSGRCSGVNEFTLDYALFCGEIISGGSIFSLGDVLAGRTAGGLGGVTQGSDDGIVRKLRNGTAIQETLNGFAARQTGLSQSLCPLIHAAAVGPPHADEAEFTLRTDPQIRTTGIYDIWEARWQTLARTNNQVLPTWTEPVVVGRVTAYTQRPHPGGVWNKPTAYVVPWFNLIDHVLSGGQQVVTSGWVAKTRRTGPAVGDPLRPEYIDPQVIEPAYRRPQDAYTVSTSIG